MKAKSAKSAKDWKDKGNQLVQERKYNEALNCYSKAIELDASDPILYSNRSAMYFNLALYENAFIDAEQALKLKPNYPKAYLRKGNALEKLNRYEEALEAYNTGLQIDSNNSQLLEAHQKLENLIQTQDININDNQENVNNFVENEDRIENKKSEGNNLVQKYALEKNVRIYFEKQIGMDLYMNGIIEEIKDGLVYFKDDKNKFHILNMKNIIDIMII